MREMITPCLIFLDRVDGAGHVLSVPKASLIQLFVKTLTGDSPAILPGQSVVRAGRTMTIDVSYTELWALSSVALTLSRLTEKQRSRT
jgi:hypothetical protein